jgi:SM-20-related protein
LKAGDENVERLGTHGWFLRDGFAGRTLALEALQLAQAQPLKPAGVQRSAVRDASIRSDETAWVDDSPLRPRFEALRLELNRAAYLGLTRFDLQLARYRPGARYVRHRDAFPGRDNRRVTAIAYLNDGWQPAHGGQLRLHVEPPLDVEPVLDRLVVFLSERIEHEVLPAHAPRWAMTAWYYGPTP